MSSISREELETANKESQTGGLFDNGEDGGRVDGLRAERRTWFPDTRGRIEEPMTRRMAKGRIWQTGR